jgi:DNA-binding NarL/FixJ family response regulator
MSVLRATEAGVGALDLDPSVGIVARDPVVRRRLLAALDYDRLPLAGQGETIDALLADAERRWPHVVVVAEEGPGAAVEAAGAVKERLSASAVVAVVGDDRRGMRRTLRAGVEAIVPVWAIETALAVTVRAVAAGLSVVPQALRRQIAPPSLSHREREVLRLLMEGATNAEIAARLTLSVGTVKSHLSSAFAKLEVTDRAEAVALLLDIPEVLEGRAEGGG